MSPDASSQLAALQDAFAAHLRDPANHPAPVGVEARRMAVYRELFYNNIESLLANNFPVIRGLLGDAAWHALVRGFYRDHGSHTPMFPELGREFLRYVEARATHETSDPPFLLELAHYEWVELALALDATDLGAIACEADGDLLSAVPLPSPLAWPLAYRWPVHRIGATFQPHSAPEAPTFLLVLRDRGDAVRFKQIDGLTYTLLQTLHDNAALAPERRASGRDLLAQLAARMRPDDPARFLADGAAAMEQLRRGDAILGTVAVA